MEAWSRLICGFVLSVSVLLTSTIGAGEGCPSTAQPARQKSFPSVPEKMRVRVEAPSWEELLERTTPRFSWGEGDLMWIQEGEEGRPVFILDRAYVIQPANGPSRCVLLEPDPAKEGTWARDKAPTRSEILLHDQVPQLGDQELGDYALLVDRDTTGRTLYRIVRQSWFGSGTAGGAMADNIYVLSEGKPSRPGKTPDFPDRWRLVGVGPHAENSTLGYKAYRSCSEGLVEIRWVESEKEPVMLIFMARLDRHRMPEEKGVDPPPHWVPGRLTTYRMYALAGPLPASLNPLSPREFTVTETETTWSDLAEQWGSWTPGWTAGSDRREAILTTWREALRDLNPGVAGETIPAGTKLDLPTYEEVTKSLEAQHHAVTPAQD